jgi:hypothetical protein
VRAKILFAPAPAPAPGRTARTLVAPHFNPTSARRQFPPHGRANTAPPCSPAWHARSISSENPEGRYSPTTPRGSLGLRARRSRSARSGLNHTRSGWDSSRPERSGKHPGPTSAPRCAETSAAPRYRPTLSQNHDAARALSRRFRQSPRSLQNVIPLGDNPPRHSASTRNRFRARQRLARVRFSSTEKVLGRIVC